jgi:hypothetical protein
MTSYEYDQSWNASFLFVTRKSCGANSIYENSVSNAPTMILVLGARDELNYWIRSEFA